MASISLSMSDADRYRACQHRRWGGMLSNAQVVVLPSHTVRQLTARCATSGTAAATIASLIRPGSHVTLPCFSPATGSSAAALPPECALSVIRTECPQAAGM